MIFYIVLCLVVIILAIVIWGWDINSDIKHSNHL